MILTVMDCMETLNGRTRSAFAALATVCLCAALVPAGASGANRQPRLSLSTVSTTSQHVTGGDVLAAVDVPSGIDVSKVRVRRNGQDVTSVFKPKPGDPRRLLGLVKGLRNGDNRLSARVNDPNAANPAELSVFNSSIEGPLFSGAQQMPFYCTTVDAGLGAATNSNCFAPTQTSYFYRTTGGAFQPLADPASRPADLAQTTTRDGRTVDYVIRVESGVIDRSIYRWAALDPGGASTPVWNDRFFYTFGGGCTTGYQQGDMPFNAVLSNRELSEGYVVLASSLNRFATACNDVLSAEAASMVKEHVIESLGSAPVWTMGEGGSGGSVQIQMASQNYPGLVDGIIPGSSFPDNSLVNSPDCRLLQLYFATPNGSSLTNAQRTAISGLEDPNGCVALSQQADVISASEGCNSGNVPASVIFNPATNPTGIRCSIFDSLINIYGTDPSTGLARRTDDNVGIQYGLNALGAGTITVNQFLDLNQDIGGFDQNGQVVAQRSVGNDDALQISYRTGRVNQGSGGYASVPVIDVRNYMDTGINVHQYIYSYEMRARLQRTNGTYANQVMWRAGGNQNVQPMTQSALDTMGTWLDAIGADSSNRTTAQKVIAAKPGNAVDGCWLGGNFVADPATIGDTGPCTTAYPPHSLPRLEAGEPLGDMVLKCQLKPVDFSAYPAMNPAQQARLQSIFPGGVCDYSKKGVEQQALDGIDREFGPSRVVRQRKRSMGLAVKSRRRGRRVAVTLTATLRPCNATIWQQIIFQRRANGKWKANGTRIANGGNCSASVTYRLGHRVPFRAISRFSTGFRGTHTKVRHVGPRR